MSKISVSKSQHERMSSRNVKSEHSIPKSTFTVNKKMKKTQIFDPELLQMIMKTINKRSSVADLFQKRIAKTSLEARKIYAALKRRKTKHQMIVEGLASHLGLAKASQHTFQDEDEKLVNDLLSEMRKATIDEDDISSLSDTDSELEFDEEESGSDHDVLSIKESEPEIVTKSSKKSLEKPEEKTKHIRLKEISQRIIRTRRMLPPQAAAVRQEKSPRETTLSSIQDMKTKVYLEKSSSSESVISKKTTSVLSTLKSFQNIKKKPSLEIPNLEKIKNIDNLVLTTKGKVKPLEMKRDSKFEKRKTIEVPEVESKPKTKDDSGFEIGELKGDTSQYEKKSYFEIINIEDGVEVSENKEVIDFKKQLKPFETKVLVYPDVKIHTKKLDKPKIFIDMEKDEEKYIKPQLNKYFRSEPCKIYVGKPNIMKERLRPSMAIKGSFQSSEMKADLKPLERKKVVKYSSRKDKESGVLPIGSGMFSDEIDSLKTASNAYGKINYYRFSREHIRKRPRIMLRPEPFSGLKSVLVRPSKIKNKPEQNLYAYEQVSDDIDMTSGKSFIDLTQSKKRKKAQKYIRRKDRDTKKYFTRQVKHMPDEKKKYTVYSKILSIPKKKILESKDEQKGMEYLRLKAATTYDERMELRNRTLQHKLKILKERAKKLIKPPEVIVEERRRESLMKEFYLAKAAQEKQSRKMSGIEETTMDDILIMRGFRGPMKNRGNIIWIKKPDFVDFLKPIKRKDKKLYDLPEENYYKKKYLTEKLLNVEKKPLFDKRAIPTYSSPSKKYEQVSLGNANEIFQKPTSSINRVSQGLRKYFGLLEGPNESF